MRFRLLLVLGLVAGSPVWGQETTADRVTLRDGSTLLGLAAVTGSGQRAGVDLLVRRDWLRSTLPKLAARYEPIAERSGRQAITERRRRLEAWRKERAATRQAAGAARDDKISTWLDAELKRLADPKAASSSPLMAIHLGRSEIRALDRAADPKRRALALAWLAELPDPEKSRFEELKGGLESRGLLVDPQAKGLPALDRMMPPMPEPELAWLARRAATEIAVDPGRRFVRYQNMVFPENADGQAPAGLGLTSALSEIKRLLDLDPTPAEDPLVKQFRAIEAAGGAGAVVTRLEIAPTLDSATVESTLWVRQARERWVPAGSRTSTVRGSDLAQGAQQALAGDPQITAAFQIVEALGLGDLGADLKQKSLTIGAATQKALANVRTASSEDLDRLAFPVLEADPGTASPERKPR